MPWCEPYTMATAAVAPSPVPHPTKRRKLPDVASPRTPRPVAAAAAEAPGLDRRTQVTLSFLTAITQVIVRLAHQDRRNEFLALRHVRLWDFYRTVLTETQQRLYIRELTKQLEGLGYTTKHVETELRTLELHWDLSS